MELLINDQILIREWDELLSKSTYTSAFQTFAFYELINSVSGLSAKVFAIKEDSQLKVLCVVTLHKEDGLKSYFSRRAIIYGGPVFAEDNFFACELLLKSIYNDLKKNAIYIEIRNYFDYNKYKSILISNGWYWQPFLDIKLFIKGKDLYSVLEIMKYNRKREIRLSFAEKATYRQAKSISEVEKLYMILKNLYINKVKLPLPNFDFFSKLYKSSIGKVFLVIHENKIIGGSFCFFLENRTIYTMYYCGLKDYNKRIFPTHLSILAALDFGLQNNLEYLDFMGAGIPNKEYGVRKYKQEFGGELFEPGRFTKVCNVFLYKIGISGLKIMKMLSN